MNKIKVILFCFILFHIGAVAQSQDEPRDSLILQELHMTQYDKDTSAEAVVLSDIGTVTIVYNFDHGLFEKYYTRHLKIKIFSQAGLSNGVLNMPLYFHSHYYGETMPNFKATTYNLEDGKIVGTPFVLKEEYEEKNSSNISVEKIAMPEVKVGSVLYITYTIKSPFISYLYWNFQHNIPTVFSEFNFIIPPFFHYMSLEQNMDTTNLIRFTREDDDDHYFGVMRTMFQLWTTKYKDNIYGYVYKDIPAFKDETFISTPEDYMIQIGFQFSKWDSKGFNTVTDKSTLSSWKQFTYNLLLNQDYFGKYLYSRGNYLTRVTESLKLEGKPEIEKIKTILNYVKTNYTWNNYYNIFSDKNMDDFITQKTGNSAAINLFLAALLKAANINANPVLLSTRSHGKIKSNYPFVYFFNDVVCYIKTDSLSLLVDGTEPLLPYYMLPLQCANGLGYVVKDNDSTWVNLTSTISNKKIESMLIEIPQNSDSLTCKFNIKGSGYCGYNLRKDWSDGYEKFSASLIGSKAMDLMDSIKVYSLHDLNEPFAISYTAALPLLKQKTDTIEVNRIVFSPFLKEPVQDNPFKMDERKYPIDISYPSESEYISTVVIPKGYKLYQMPAELTYLMANKKATYTYKAKQISDTVIRFVSEFSLNVAIFQPSDYKELKAMYDVAIKKWKEPIILEKN